MAWKASNSGVMRSLPTLIATGPVGGNFTSTRTGRPLTWLVMPDTIVMGNCRPFAPWMVMMLTASSSVSGSTVSATRALSDACRRAHSRYSRSEPPSASLHARAWSMTNRSRRHKSRGRPWA